MLLYYTYCIPSQKHIFFHKKFRKNAKTNFLWSTLSSIHHTESRIWFWIRIGIKTMPFPNTGQTKTSEGNGRAWKQKTTAGNSALSEHSGNLNKIISLFVYNVIIPGNKIFQYSPVVYDVPFFFLRFPSGFQTTAKETKTWRKSHWLRSHHTNISITFISKCLQFLLRYDKRFNLFIFLSLVKGKGKFSYLYQRYLLALRQARKQFPVEVRAEAKI